MNTMEAGPIVSLFAVLGVALLITLASIDWKTAVRDITAGWQHLLRWRP